LKTFWKSVHKFSKNSPNFKNFPHFGKCPKHFENFQIFKMCPKKLKISQKRKFWAYAPILKMCPKYFPKNDKILGMCPNFENVPKIF
jgi:hypothetical protein